MPDATNQFAETSSKGNNCAFHCIIARLLSSEQDLQEVVENENFKKNYNQLRQKFITYYDLPNTLSFIDLIKITKAEFQNPCDQQEVWGQVLREYSRDNNLGLKTSDAHTPDTDDGKFIDSDTLKKVANQFGISPTVKEYDTSNELLSTATSEDEKSNATLKMTVHWQYNHYSIVLDTPDANKTHNAMVHATENLFDGKDINDGKNAVTSTLKGNKVVLAQQPQQSTPPVAKAIVLLNDSLKSINFPNDLDKATEEQLNKAKVAIDKLIANPAYYTEIFLDPTEAFRLKLQELAEKSAFFVPLNKDFNEQFLIHFVANGEFKPHSETEGLQLIACGLLTTKTFIEDDSLHYKRLNALSLLTSLTEHYKTTTTKQQKERILTFINYLFEYKIIEMNSQLFDKLKPLWTQFNQDTNSTDVPTNNELKAKVTQHIENQIPQPGIQPSLTAKTPGFQQNFNKLHSEQAMGFVNSTEYTDFVNTYSKGLSHIAGKIFLDSKPSDWIKENLSGKNSSNTSLKKYRFFLQKTISNNIVQDIISAKNFYQRVALVKFYRDVAVKTFEMGDFGLAETISGSLLSASVQKLTTTEKYLESNWSDSNTKAVINDIGKSGGMYPNFEHLLKSSHTPIISPTIILDDGIEKACGKSQKLLSAQLLGAGKPLNDYCTIYANAQKHFLADAVSADAVTTINTWFNREIPPLDDKRTFAEASSLEPKVLTQETIFDHLDLVDILAQLAQKNPETLDFQAKTSFESLRTVIKYLNKKFPTPADLLNQKSSFEKLLEILDLLNTQKTIIQPPAGGFIGKNGNALFLKTLEAYQIQLATIEGANRKNTYKAKLAEHPAVISFLQRQIKGFKNNDDSVKAQIYREIDEIKKQNISATTPLTTTISATTKPAKKAPEKLFTADTWTNFKKAVLTKADAEIKGENILDFPNEHVLVQRIPNTGDITLTSTEAGNTTAVNKIVMLTCEVIKFAVQPVQVEIQGGSLEEISAACEKLEATLKNNESPHLNIIFSKSVIAMLKDTATQPEKQTAIKLLGAYAQKELQSDQLQSVSDNLRDLRQVPWQPTTGANGAKPLLIRQPATPLVDALPNVPPRPTGNPPTIK